MLKHRSLRHFVTPLAHVSFFRTEELTNPPGLDGTQTERHPNWYEETGRSARVNSRRIESRRGEDGNAPSLALPESKAKDRTSMRRRK